MARTPAGPAPATGPGPSRGSRPEPAGPPSGRRPPPLAVACGLVLVEVVALLAGAVAGLVALVRGADVGPTVFLVLLALGAAALLGSAGRALWSGRRWGRGPVLTAQIFVVLTAATWWGAGAGVRAVVPILVALVVVVAVLSPRVMAATAGGRPPAS